MGGLQCSIMVGPAESLTAEWGANAIISTVPWPEVVQIAKTRTKLGVPVLFLTTCQPLAVSPSPNLFRMSYTASGYVQCLADLVKLFNWRQVVVLCEDDDYENTSASVIPLLNDACLAVGSYINGRVAFPPLDLLSNPNCLVCQELERLKPTLCKVFIIDRWSSSLGVLGLMTKHQVWIAGDDITLDSTFTPSSLSSFMQGVIEIKTYLHESRKPYQDFSVKFQAEYGKRGETNFKPGMYERQAYDAVHVIAHANACF